MTSYGIPFTTRPEIKGTFGVAASTHWLATAVAMRTLERGAGQVRLARQQHGAPVDRAAEAARQHIQKRAHRGEQEHRRDRQLDDMGDVAERHH